MRSAALIVIGNEILSGRTQDGHTAFLGRELGALGIRLSEVRIVPDIREIIARSVNDLKDRVDFLFTTGGIGPTHDDITAESIAFAFGVPLVVDPDAFGRLKSHYELQGREFNAARQRMARVPEGAVLIDNPVSIAPGFRIANVFVMAGIPAIMRAMWASLRPDLTGGPPVVSRTLSVSAGEGELAEGLAQLQAAFPDIDIGSYPSMSSAGLRVRIVLRTTDPARLEEAYGRLKRMVADLGAIAEMLPDGDQGRR